MLFLYGARILNLQKLFPHLNITKIRAFRILVHHFLRKGHIFKKRIYIWLANGLVVKSTDCSSKEFRFNSQHTRISSQLSITTQLEAPNVLF